MRAGVFITLEGIEGVGKSTHALYIRERLEQHGYQTLLTREPGGTKTGEAIRDILLHATSSPINNLTELLLIFSARAQHLQEIIIPALKANKVVICDRFTDATYAYQGGGRAIDRQQIQILEALVQEGLKPDLTILLDSPVEVGLGRANHRSKADRFESETVNFFQRVRQEYLALAGSEPERILVIDANRPLQQIQQDINSILAARKLC